MKILFFLILILFPIAVLADLTAGIGASGGFATESSATHPDGKPYLKSDGSFGPRVDLEFGFKRLTLALFATYDLNKGKTQYQDKEENIDAPNMDTAVGILKVGAGLRYYFFVAKPIRAFLGGGGTLGALALRYDTDRVWANSDLKTEESQKIQGAYMEGGVDYIMRNKYGLRLLWQNTQLKSDEFKTLGNERMNLNNNYISLNYIQYVSTKW